jgi:hypothetical protein
VIELAEYTITICSNEKNFPKRYRWCLTNKIVDTALEIMNDVNTANSIYVSTKGDYELRRHYQTNALAYTARLLGLMEVAYIKFNIPDKRIKYWTQLVVDARELIKKWRKSDSDRFKNFK